MALGGIAGASATGSYYTGLIEASASYKKEALADVYEAEQEEFSKQVYHGAIVTVNEEIERIDSEVNAYVSKQVEAKGLARLEAHKAEIKQASDLAIKDLKAYIDTLE